MKASCTPTPTPTRPATRYADLPLSGARWDDDLAEFVLPYELVRTAPDPDAMLLTFLQNTYAAATTTAHWDHTALERPNGGHG